MSLISKGCPNCRVGFKIELGQEYIWNWCPMCGSGLELDIDDLEIEYEAFKEDEED